MKYRRYLIGLMSVMMTAGCTASAVRLTEAEEDYGGTASYEYSEEEAVSLTLMRDSAEASDDSVAVDGRYITISEPGVYVITGELDNGRITVDTEKDGTVQLVFMNVKMTSDSGPVLFVENAGETVLTAEAGTSVTLDVSGEDADGKKAAVHAKDDLVISGTGRFTVISAGGDGIHANDDLTIADADLDITSASDGIDVNSGLKVSHAVLGIEAGKDGIHTGDEDADEPGGDIVFSESEIVIIAEDDGVQSAGDVTFEGGTYDVTAGGGSKNAAASTGGSFFPSDGFMNGRNREGQQDTMSGATPSAEDPSGRNGSWSMPDEDTEGRPGMPEGQNVFGGKEDSTAEEQTDKTASEQEEDTAEKSKGISAEGTVTFRSGTFSFDTADDAVNAADALVIDDGTFTIKAGDDALHADNTLTINGGTVAIESSYEGLESAAITVNGGEITVKASDDGINSVDKSSASGGMFASDGSTITFRGGTVTVDAGGDGIDSNGSVLLDGGTLVILGPVNAGNGALDFAGSFTIKSGRLMAGGSAGMAQVPSSSDVNILVIGTDGTGTVTVKDASGSTVAEYSSEKTFRHLVIADEAIRTGETYTVYQGERELGTVTVSESVTRIGGTGSNGWGMPYQGGGFRPGQGGRRPGSGRQEGSLPEMTPPAWDDMPQDPGPFGEPAGEEKDPL